MDRSDMVSAWPLLIFLHLPKTGGRTLSQVIQRQYDQDAVLALYTSTSGEELAALTRHRLETLRAIVGHFYFGVDAFVPNPALYVTLLRDPADRVMSHYYFVRTDPTHYLYETARRLSLREYVIACGVHEPNNDQTRLLAGRSYAADPGAHPNEMLASATVNLRERFALVGLTEDFDRSLLLMQHVFGWRRPFYVRSNATRGRPRKADVATQTMQVIERYNALDIELYRYGKTLFYEQLDRLGDHVESELRTFRRLNGSYGKLRLALSSAATRIRMRHGAATSDA